MKRAVAIAALLLSVTRVGAADLAAGTAKAAACTACHGKDGVSQMAGAPSLAGQPDGFLQWQLVYFRSGTRKDAVMQPMAASLSVCVRERSWRDS